MTNGSTARRRAGARLRARAVMGLIVLIGACRARAQGPPTVDDFAFTSCDDRVEVRLNQPVADVLAAMGQVREVRIFPNESDAKWDALSYRYDDLWLEAYRGFGRVRYVWVKSGCWKTARGVRIGDPISRVRASYAGVQSLDSGDLGIGLADPESIEGLAQLSLVFVVKEGRVAEFVAMVPEI